MTNTIVEIVLSGIIVPLVGLIIYLIKKWKQQKDYKDLVLEWSNQALEALNILTDKSIKIEPPLKEKIRELVEKEKEIRKEKC